MELKSLLVDSKTTWVEFPGLDGFEVELANLSRKELQGIRKNCLNNKFNRKTRQFEESLDDEKFVREFAQKTVKNWKGLTVEHLSTLMLIDTNKASAEEIPYSVDNAEILVANSAEFDTWLNEVVFDLENFRDSRERKVPGKAPDPVSK